VKYLLLIHSDESAWQGASEQVQREMHTEYMAFTQAIIDSGEMGGGDPLEGADTAVTVSSDGGKVLTVDGPFAETKEQLGGYYVVDVASRDRAVELAGQLPGVARGLDRIEVRPIRVLPG
jgi:hypothetical protein